MAVFIIFPKSRNTFQYPLSKRVCKRLSRVVAFIIELYREYESRGSHCAAALRSFTRGAELQRSRRAHALRRSVGDIKAFPKTTLRLSSLQKHVSGSNAYQIALFLAFQKGVSNPLIKTALRLSSAKITLKVVWKPSFYARKVMINAP